MNLKIEVGVWIWSLTARDLRENFTLTFLLGVNFVQYRGCWERLKMFYYITFKSFSNYAVNATLWRVLAYNSKAGFFFMKISMYFGKNID